MDWVADADVVFGEVIQLRDGRAGVVTKDAVSGSEVGVYTSGIFTVQKTASMVVLDGSLLYWDHSANKAHLLHRADRDFYLGQAMDDATSSATTVPVALNLVSDPAISLQQGFASIPISTAGFIHVAGTGKGVNLIFDTATESQKLDALSQRGMSPSALAIVDALICINTNGDASAFDLNIGLANGTHATDADSITESLFCHVDGASTNIAFESDDGTTEVAATDSTVDFTEGTPFLVQWDLRNNADIQVYVDGVNVLPSSVFKLNAATGPLKLLAHMEKTSDNSPGNVSVMRLEARTAQV